MRYFLFVLLFIFTNHSFSDELDGKGIDCKMQDVDTEQYRKKMYWFNNGRWILVNIFDAQQFILKFPDSPDISTFQRFYNTYDDNFITFDTEQEDNPDYDYINYYKLNRKTLEIKFHRVNKSTNKKKLEEVGICKVFNGFEAVKRRQEDLIRIDQQEKKKAREGNKI